jgi:thiamine-monophosphate kinase
VNEFDLISRLVGRLAPERLPDSVALGVGDDAAQLTHGDWPLLAVDTLVEHVHWNPDVMDVADVGAKLLTCNLSDIAAMGGVPGPMLLSLALGTGVSSSFVEELAEGIDRARVAHDLDSTQVFPIGGDLTRSPGGHVLSLTLLGRPARPGRLLRRTDAILDDGIWVSGPLGSAAAGLALLQAAIKDDAFSALIARHRSPMARLDLVPELTDSPLVHAAIDLSDGLAGDLVHILEASEVGAVLDLDALPAHELLDEACRRLGADRTKLQVQGGEDFELLVTASPAAGPHLAALGMTRIGRIVAERRLIYTRNERRIDVTYRGFQHFE